MTPSSSLLDGATAPAGFEALKGALHQIDRPLALAERDGLVLAGEDSRDPVRAYVPACLPENLGDPAFRESHRIKYPYVAGAMANGIGSVEIVEAMGRAGMLGFFGSAGLSLSAVEDAIDRLQALGDIPHGFNLIHSPSEPGLEAGVVDLYLRRGVRLVEASAYLDVTLPLVRYRVHGIHRGPSGEVATPNRVIAKVSRVEVASKFFSPPPEGFLRELVFCREISPEEAQMASEIPLAQDLTSEADSGGHTDNRPLVTLLPTMLSLRQRMQEGHRYSQALRVGAAGGISTPNAAAAAFLMGASYVLTGSINQACVESGSSDLVRRMLAEAGQADVAMAPAADMFEMGVKVQLLKRGTMFAMRAAKLYELYRTCGGLDEIPAPQRVALERDLFRAPLDDIWRQTREYFLARDPSQAERAQREPKHKMALVFRWYLGMSSRWANAGEPSRKLDYQVWCGPAMGAFNEWAKGTFLQDPKERRVVTLALNILVGAAVLTRLHALRCQGVPVDPRLAHVPPRPLEDLRRLLKLKRSP